ncbi:MAG: SDR family oxidoreductase [bacterium]
MKTQVSQDVNPVKWYEHLYGLTLERWNSFHGKNFWITGAGTGYGRCIACALAAAGAQVFLTGRRIEKLQETIEEIASFSITTESCHIVKCDVTNYDDILRACDKVKSLCSSLNGLVHCAAIPSKPGSLNPLQEDSLEYWNKIMATNVTAPWLSTKTIFPYMLNSGSIRVLFLTSGAGWASTSGVGMYNVSKAALNSLCHSMAQEYAHSFPGKDIQMNALDPGEARTEMNQGPTQSPYAVCSMVLILLSHPKGGPNGYFFHRDGRHLQFCYTEPYYKLLIVR